MEKVRTCVLKFGGASVADASSFSKIADLIIDRKKVYKNLVVVVSAMGKTTDHLLKLAREVHPEPPMRELDMLISVGERISVALLAMALALKNCEAVSFTGSQSGIITCGNHTDAKIHDVKPKRVLQALEENLVAIVAGFQGVSVKGEITTLGRGGSDTTAVALAVALGAERVEFYKDVDGIYDNDPKNFLSAKYIPKMSYDQALQVVNKGHPVLHPRSIELAKKNSLPILVRSFLSTTGGTQILNEEQSSPKIATYE